MGVTSELLDEVLAHPDDDGPRRVYADWLSERGDPRGELIAVQCELARRDATDPARRELELRELDLLREHGPTWIAELGFDPAVTATHRHGPVEVARGPTVMFHRGFPDAVKVSPGQLAAAHLDDVPIHRLVLTEVHDLALLPAIPTLRTLRLRGGNIDTRQLATAPIITHVEELILQSMSTDDIRGLVVATLPALRKLTLDTVRFPLNTQLTRAPWIPALRELCISNTYNLALRDLLLSKAWRDLKRLELASNLDDGDVAAIASSHLARGLEYLEISLGYRDLGEATIEAFSRSKRLGKLQRLVLHGRTRDSDLAPLEKRWGPKLVVRS
jgi:uncharacterized protein (TIGR02996 family)